jgi:hypothetical protein
MEVDIIVTIALATAFIVFITQVGRILRSNAMHRTIREALSRDSNLTPDLLDKIEQDKSRGFGDTRIGLVLVALGAALFVFGLISDGSDAADIQKIAVFPVFVGAALLGRVWYLARRGAVS